MYLSKENFTCPIVQISLSVLKQFTLSKTSMKPCRYQVLVNGVPCNSVVTDKMKLLKDLEKEFYKAEAVGPKVEKVHYLKW